MYWCLQAEQQAFRCSSAVFVTDNLGGLSALCKGASTVEDLGCLIHAILLVIAGLRMRAWFEHVDSKANCADGGSRVGNKCPLAAGLRIPLAEVSLPHWPQQVLGASASEWLSLFQA